MKCSLKKQITITFVSIMFGTLLLCWVANNLFLEKFYVANKEKSLLEAYNTINSLSERGNITSDTNYPIIDKLCSNENISLIVIDSDGSVIMSTTTNNDILKRQFWDSIFNLENRDNEVASNDNYVLLRSNDEYLDTEYLILWGNLSNGNIIMMRTAVESIKASVHIANRFLLYLTLIALIASGFVIMKMSKRITEPIMELTDISEKMANLDFDAKYTSGGVNEIGLLGNNINNLSAKLEKTISELKTANNELQKDIDKKIQIDEMRKEFLSNVSHELKTPIAIIQGYAEGLKEFINDNDESRDYYCDVIIDESNKMNLMVKKLLTLNQLEFGNESVTMERFDLVELIRGILNVSQILIKEKNIVLIFEEKEPIYVWADEFKVEEVITNFFNNAINHVKNENIIEIKISKSENGVRTSIFNTGDPIPEDDIDKIWIKFYKVDKARTREYGGSGIGLSIVKAIMESFHKECGVNNYDNGVEFWFELDSNSDV